MRRLTVFNHITLDGYFTDGRGDMTWAHKQDPEWAAFAEENAAGGGAMLFGRVTYAMMASFWPTKAARDVSPELAKQMNAMPKFVFSRTLETASWTNTQVLRGDVAAETRKLKSQPGPSIVVLGSGSIVKQLTEARLIDEYQLVLNATALGAGRTLFDGVSGRLDLSLENARVFSNGNVVLSYKPKL